MALPECVAKPARTSREYARNLGKFSIEVVLLPQLIWKLKRAVLIQKTGENSGI